MKNVNVEETANIIQSKMEHEAPSNEMEFIKAELDNMEIEAQEIRTAIISQIEF